MPYGMRLEREAVEDFERLPQACRRRVFRHLELLCESPTALSRPSHFPYRPGFQLYSFNFVHENARWFMNVLFKYGVDEQSLFVAAIGAKPVGLTGDDDFSVD